MGSIGKRALIGEEGAMPKKIPEFVLEWTFPFPRNLIWDAWTRDDILSEWYGPGVETITHKLEVSEGGEWLLEFRFGPGSNYQRANYTIVKKPDRLEFILATADENWNVIANPMMPNWPRQMMTAVEFTEVGAGTKIRLTWTPHEATDAELAAFEAVMDQMGNNWQLGMKKIEEIFTRQART